MTAPVRLAPATSIVHLEFNAGEDIEIELIVSDKLGAAVPLTSAVATIALPGCTAQHVWSAPAGNLQLGTETGSVLLSATAEQTAAWYAAFGDSEWQLDTVDVFGRHKRSCEGDVRVNPTRAGGGA
jgi:hypothetical protein